ncbi:hypothetical protein KSF_063070 [Reticulibacter mediterranei]|uniref:Uncharacterized protein n=1 Tax=Reticulibacter mediterranei TaxID=2778369 RepID=A0A8J3IQU2_9CHLR|nr:hypothetical protein KSF_063070 [Reticulibacter mediterranei]
MVFALAVRAVGDAEILFVPPLVKPTGSRSVLQRVELGSYLLFSILPAIHTVVVTFGEH